MTTVSQSDPGVLVDLLGETRALIVERLRRQAHSVPELAAELGLTEVAVRRQVQVLERDGLVDAETVRKPGRGRPVAHYTLTDKARRLYPDGSAAFAKELLTFLEEEHGRAALLGFLRWRQQRQGARYAEALAAAEPEDHEASATVLAELLSEDGFLSEVETVTDEDGRTYLELRQGHCAIKDVAEEHPEVCAYEAALFQKLLGGKLSRRQTIAGGAQACVCHLTPATELQSITAQRSGAIHDGNKG